ncbi:winged helix-turn-helix domain-containing protein [Salinisphaera sp.]|uniref:winged helix-turn-helix domain-containing protein n=1 Tax=Salinisphaera sp. TaxID=1914330 RepID=UPI000C423876|nr:winged helix-turn-helix domain-containing protein [Salinisphaera sp.]MBS63518.1 transcriptional regulator [Salinisphaera sp.]
MIESILGSVAAEKTLLWLDRFETGYASEIARYSGLSTSQVNKQLAKFEDSGLIKARPAGRTRLYVWNPSNALVSPLRDLLSRTYELLPERERSVYEIPRRRPRSRAKPLTPIS